MADKKTLKEKYAESKKLRVTVKIAEIVAAIGAGFTGGWFAATKLGGKK